MFGLDRESDSVNHPIACVVLVRHYSHGPTWMFGNGRLRPSAKY